MYFSKIIAAIVIAAVLCVIFVATAAMLIYRYLINNKINDGDKKPYTKERGNQRPCSD